MKEFSYKIQDENGIHARPAGLLCKLAKGFDSEITISKDDKSVNATKLMALMGLGVRRYDEIKVIASGIDEDKAIGEMQSFFEANL